MCEVDDACRLLDTLLQRKVALVKVELLELCLGGLPALARRRTVVALQLLANYRPNDVLIESHTYPVQTTRLNHVEEWAAVSGALLLTARTDRGA